MDKLHLTLRVSARWLGALLLLTAMAGCAESVLVNDPSFDSWCGDDLCEWDTDEGRISRVKTWHRRDYGVAFVDSPTQISQTVKNGLESCLRLDFVLESDPDTQLTVALDYDADGDADFTQIVPGVDWKNVQFLVYTGRLRGNIRYTLRKTGGGRATVAQFRVVEDFTCTGEETGSRADLSGPTHHEER